MYTYATYVQLLHGRGNYNNLVQVKRSCVVEDGGGGGGVGRGGRGERER